MNTIQEKEIPLQNRCKRALLVDNDQDMSWLLKHVLRQMECDLIITNTWAATLNELAKTPLDLILLDIPLVGFSIANFLRVKNQYFPRVPVVIISPSAAEPARKKIQEIGQYAFIDKPFVLDLLVNKIREALAADMTQSID